ncbi:hypothetical protein [Spiroplasma poulsonii]|uniref:Uncharacterized protein n=1 Tax=Spiroplasma poulsonii TaxID=2138 RepID=A0A2R6Y5Q8_9MOLU|nr:hypothetical protein [Spiroplasma poulsonii]KAF0849765.1 hypothetical protein MSROBK_P00340 [Spiroplasma poulsonii]PTQ58148.1 hypothetical protein SMSRO_SFP00450 [Spiroplasma poulsonii]PWF94089.1 hypothetical protein SMSE_24960 [Spiroplasma poulsonii]PWF94215.1 hypothetical protein SMH99_26340 [Spiroplasma poulsonii]PWF94263.1 hypothetical protein SMH99_26820 [Spiroplasma poulsonii]
MRIIPYELYKYTPNLSLMALRKEFGMYDYCLNMNKTNIAMQPFLNLGRNYFDLSFQKWFIEMKKRKNYVNSFHKFYAEKNKFSPIKTDFFLLLECCLQWDLKEFTPYNINLSWYEIILKFFKQYKIREYYFDNEKYQNLLYWYKNKFMSLNKTGKIKPKQLNMIEVIDFCKSTLLFNLEK